MLDEQTTAFVEICQLKYAYAAHLDNHELDQLVALFTEDAVCEFGPFGTWTGRDEIRQGYGDTMARHEGPLPGIHSVTNPQIEVSGDSATGTWYLLDLLFGAPEEAPLKIIGKYHETYRRDAGQAWLIETSGIEFLWSERKGRMC